MRRLQFLVVLGLIPACVPAAPSTHPAQPASPTPPTEVVNDDTSADEPEIASREDPISDRGPETTIIVMEADDFGGGPDAIVAAPKRPALPSMMTDIAMAPSR